MTFDTYTYSIKQLLNVYKTFNIPFFQRDYSWDKIYYSKFIDDIISMIIIEDNILKISDYFIGTMLFVSKGDKNKEIVDVIDGQQRLTVITILFSVISDIFQNLDDDLLSMRMFDYVRFSDDDGIYQNRIRSITSSPFFEKFIQVRKKQNENIPNSDEEKNLKNTYEFFLDYLNNIDKLKKIETFKHFEHKDIIKVIRDQLLNTSVIIIDTTDRSKSNMIFEILNAKAKSLASIDLIKNIIFEAFYNDENNLDLEAQQIWTNIQKNLHDREDNTNIATFYRQFWISKYKKVTNSKLYDSFKEQIKTTKTSNMKKNIYLEFLKNLEKESIRYNHIVKPRIEDYNKRNEYKWLVESLESINNTFGHFQGRVVLLALMDIKERDLIKTRKLQETILYLENFIFSYSVIGKLRSNFYEPHFSKFSIKVRISNSKEETNKTIKEELIDKLKSNYIKYNDFESSFIELKYTKNKENNNLNTITKYVVNKIASSFNKSDHKIEDSSIEHILPESESRVINIGNLIALESALNHQADSLNYEDKKTIYQKSNYIQVKAFLNEYANFSEEDIKTRAKKLAKYYYENIIGNIEK